MPSSVGAYVAAIAVMITDGRRPRTVIRFGLRGRVRAGTRRVALRGWAGGGAGETREERANGSGRARARLARDDDARHPEGRERLHAKGREWRERVVVEERRVRTIVLVGAQLRRTSVGDQLGRHRRPEISRAVRIARGEGAPVSIWL